MISFFSLSFLLVFLCEALVDNEVIPCSTPKRFRSYQSLLFSFFFSCMYCSFLNSLSKISILLEEFIIDRGALVSMAIVEDV